MCGGGGGAPGKEQGKSQAEDGPEARPGVLRPPGSPSARPCPWARAPLLHAWPHWAPGYLRGSGPSPQPSGATQVRSLSPGVTHRGETEARDRRPSPSVPGSLGNPGSAHRHGALAPAPAPDHPPAVSLQPPVCLAGATLGRGARVPSTGVACGPELGSSATPSWSLPTQPLWEGTLSPPSWSGSRLPQSSLGPPLVPDTRQLGRHGKHLLTRLSGEGSWGSLRGFQIPLGALLAAPLVLQPPFTPPPTFISVTPAAGPLA